MLDMFDSKFDFGPKCDVRKVLCSECSKFGILVFIPRLHYIRLRCLKISLIKITLSQMHIITDGIGMGKKVGPKAKDF